MRSIPIKFIIIGDSGTGKSNMMNRYIDGIFDGEFKTTIGMDFKIKQVEMEGKLYRLFIWDTAGQDIGIELQSNQIREQAQVGRNGSCQLVRCQDQDIQVPTQGEVRVNETSKTSMLQTELHHSAGRACHSRNVCLVAREPCT